MSIRVKFSRGMTGKIILNNILAIGIHMVLCAVVYLLIVIPFPFSLNKYAGGILFNAFFTILLYTVYFMSGRFILSNTHNIRLNLVSVVGLVAVIIIGLYFVQYGGTMFTLMPFILILEIMEHSGIFSIMTILFPQLMILHFSY